MTWIILQIPLPFASFLRFPIKQTSQHHSSKFDNTSDVDRLSQCQYSPSFLNFPKRQILDSSEVEEFADGNFKFHENAKMYAKKVENTVGKEKLLLTSNFPFSHSVLKLLLLQTHKNQGLFGKGLTHVCSTSLLKTL